MSTRLLAAMSVYLVLAILAIFTLDGGIMRNMVLIVLAGLAAKTWIAHKAGW